MQVLDIHFDFPGFQVGVFHPSRAPPHQASDLNHPLCPQINYALVRLRGSIRVEDYLHDPRPVPQVNEGNTAMIPAAMHPAGKGNIRAH
jgi:hypothetical protein